MHTNQNKKCLYKLTIVNKTLVVFFHGESFTYNFYFYEETKKKQSNILLSIKVSQLRSGFL